MFKKIKCLKKKKKSFAGKPNNFVREFRLKKSKPYISHSILTILVKLDTLGEIFLSTDFFQQISSLCFLPKRK